MRIFPLLLLLFISAFSFGQSLHLENDPAQYQNNLNDLIKDKTFGGISGIEYVPGLNKWYFITDGVGTGRPSYLFEIDAKTQNGLPDWTKSAGHPVQGLTQSEAIRFDGEKFWIGTEEGIEPGVVNPDSSFEKGAFSMIMQQGQNWAMDKPSFEYRSKLNNRGYESLAIAGNDTVATISEWPFSEDGRYARLKLMNCKTAPCEMIAEYAYELDINSCNGNGQKVDGSLGNGISEILYIGNGRYLMMERCFTGSSGDVKLYETRITADATNVGTPAFKELAKAPSFRPLPKQEVFNFSSIKNIKKIDNLEGMTWGPDHKTIAVISDNNFEADTTRQKTQWFVLKVIGDK
ncbi:esterase-like activity of phytase family protein [Dyadobacter luticola]|uniref:Esterase-like activity of phytase family protein n=1 Tax=Dyadobacter luticola TaxID=1979387 RepID=A0A5R9L2D7_9BACT|nr:esterase-like activity of phytase family protein [Dyadobacter luticola]TLV02726.1 esterase-like activity of phytase family protein [Dyadobacter luticola]